MDVSCSFHQIFSNHDKLSQVFGALVRPRLVFPSTITIDSRVDKVSLIKEDSMR